MVLPSKSMISPCQLSVAIQRPSVVPATCHQFNRAASAADAFAPKRWLPPPPPPAPPEKPKAPPLPFKYLGKALVDGEAVAFLGQGPRTHLLRSGDILAGYKVESVSATEIALVYLPLNETQRLTFGSDH